MLPHSEFKATLYETLRSRLTVDHPLVGTLLDPTPHWSLLRELTLQGYQLTKHFLVYIEHLFFHCPQPRHKRRLLTNMWEEETGKLSKTKNHVLLMQDFIRAIGITDAERDAALPHPETAELIDFRMQACTDPARYHIGAAAVMIASEGQNLETRAGQARHTLLSRVYGLDERALLFFSVHAKEDIGHVREGVELVADCCRTASQQEDALATVAHTCQLFWNMYEGVLRRHRAEHPTNAPTPPD